MCVYIYIHIIFFQQSLDAGLGDVVIQHIWADAKELWCVTLLPCDRAPNFLGTPKSTISSTPIVYVFIILMQVEIFGREGACRRRLGPFWWAED